MPVLVFIRGVPARVHVDPSPKQIGELAMEGKNNEGEGDRGMEERLRRAV